MILLKREAAPFLVADEFSLFQGYHPLMELVNDLPVMRRQDDRGTHFVYLDQKF
jgi:GTPase